MGPGHGSGRVMFRALGLAFLCLLTLAAAWGCIVVLALAWVGGLFLDAFGKWRR